MRFQRWISIKDFTFEVVSIKVFEDLGFLHFELFKQTKDIKDSTKVIIVSMSYEYFINLDSLVIV